MLTCWPLFLKHSQNDEKDSDTSDPPHSPKENPVCTEFFEWCCSYFAQPVMSTPTEHDPESEAHYEQEFRLTRAARVQNEASEEQRRAGMFTWGGVPLALSLTQITKFFPPFFPNRNVSGFRNMGQLLVSTHPTRNHNYCQKVTVEILKTLIC